MHAIPLWLLFFSLFLPRISLVCAYFVHQVPYAQLPPLAALAMFAFIPRVLILIYIYVNLGFGAWFIAHLVALICVWAGSGTTAVRRRG